MLAYYVAMSRNVADYELDFVAWAEEQARLLRAREYKALDIENIAEEIESLGRSDKREIVNRMIVLIAHLLKCQHQPELRSKSWLASIREQRRKIEMLVEESPSLRPLLPGMLAKAFASARKEAASEMDVREDSLASVCPFSLEDVLREDFLPEVETSRSAG
jgi:hypothetical protein